MSLRGMGPEAEKPEFQAAWSRGGVFLVDGGAVEAGGAGGLGDRGALGEGGDHFHLSRRQGRGPRNRLTSQRKISFRWRG
jgi:hypothetical protein